MTIDGDQILKEILDRHNINLAVLVAEVGLWANPEVFVRLKASNGLGVW